MSDNLETKTFIVGPSKFYKPFHCSRTFVLLNRLKHFMCFAFFTYQTYDIGLALEPFSKWRTLHTIITETILLFTAYQKIIILFREA